MSRKLCLAAALLVLANVGLAAAQLPPGIFAGQRDFRLAPAGTYGVDPSHTAIIAKVQHIGYGLSVFRFDKVTGALTWNPAAPTTSSLNVTVETASIDTPVPGFATELAGDKYLESGQFPQASFVSTRFREIDPAHGKVDGRFTLLGRTEPLTFNVALIGAGKGILGHPRIGAEATAAIDPARFGLPAMLGNPILLVIDVEFAQGS